MIGIKNILNAKSKFVVLIIASIFILVGLSGYWIKSQLGINFFRDVSLSRHFPFNTLAPHKVIYNPRPGILLQDSFDSFSLFGNWNNLWMLAEEKVTKEYASRGADNSRCLLIKNYGSGSWSFAHNKYIQVKKGDTFTFTVSVKLHGENTSAYASVAAFNKKKEVMSWNYITEKTKKTSEWTILKSTFTIHDSISFIKFRLSGIGAGEFLFDNVIFMKN